MATLVVNRPIAPIVPTLAWTKGSGLPTRFSYSYVPQNGSEDGTGAVGLLPGLCFDATSGVITGTPTLTTVADGVQYKDT